MESHVNRSNISDTVILIMYIIMYICFCVGHQYSLTAVTALLESIGRILIIIVLVNFVYIIIISWLSLLAWLSW